MYWEIRSRLEAARSRRRRMLEEAEALQDRIERDSTNQGLQERAENLYRGMEKLADEIAELENESRAAIASGMRSGSFGSGEGADVGMPSFDREGSNAHRDAALRSMERHSGAFLSDDAARRVEGLVRGADPGSLTARYVAAVADPAYFSGWCRMLADPVQGHTRFSPAESEAWRTTAQIMSERAMNEGTGSAGQFGVPFTLDPSIIGTSSGAINPLRDLGKVITVSTHQWKGVSSDGVVASYVAEGVELTDNSPTLVQPTINVMSGKAFVPISIELSQDWTALTGELGTMFGVARDTLDATKMLTGFNSTNEPCGILSIGQTGALTTSQRVLTATTNTFVAADTYTMKQSMASSVFYPNSTWVSHPNIVDTIYKFVATADTTNAPIMAAGRGGDILGRPVREMSTMASSVATGNRIAMLGDFSGFQIVDRLGSFVELIPHLFGPNQYPTGQRGVFFMWRTGTGVVAANKLRYLEVK